MRIRRKLAVVAVTAALAALGVASTAQALPNGNDAKGSTGSCIDNLYGNATNEAPGRPGIIPSLSPGPRTLSGNFISVGDVQKGARALNLGLTGGEINQLICTFP